MHITTLALLFTTTLAAPLIEPQHRSITSRHIARSPVVLDIANTSSLPGVRTSPAGRVRKVRRSPTPGVHVVAAEAAAPAIKAVKAVEAAAAPAAKGAVKEVAAANATGAAAAAAACPAPAAAAEAAAAEGDAAAEGEGAENEVEIEGSFGEIIDLVGGELKQDILYTPTVSLLSSPLLSHHSLHV
jgi:hypothetical protein